MDELTDQQRSGHAVGQSGGCLDRSVLRKCRVPARKRCRRDARLRSKYLCPCVRALHAEIISRRQLVIGARSALLIAAVSTLLAACGTAPTSPQPEPPSGTIELNQTPLTFSDGGGGTGTLYFQGQPHQFTIGGLGVGGEGVAILQTSGEAYRLGSFARFAGTYRKAPAEAVLNHNAGGLWLQNAANGVLLHLQPPPGGRIPPIGSDAVLIETRY